VSEYVTISINGRQVRVTEGTHVVTALGREGIERFRKSVSGKPRGPLCGMGVCFECRVTINGQPHQRSCATIVEEGMEVVTDG